MVSDSADFLFLNLFKIWRNLVVGLEMIPSEVGAEILDTIDWKVSQKFQLITSNPRFLIRTF